MYQKKNELKNLIYIQENKPCNEQTIKGLFRSIVEPILENNVEGLVLCRLENKSKKEFSGILKRLEYTNSKVYDFSDKPISDKFENILNEKIWNKTEFVYVLAERFGAVLVFDYEESDIDGFAQIYIMHNSKRLSDAFDVINKNSKVDLNEYQEKFHPDRRDNDILNSSIRKIIENLNETNQEVLISQMEQENRPDAQELQERLNFFAAKSSYLSHEMRNLFSICNLYSNIIKKQYDNVIFTTKETEQSVDNARDCIRKSLMMAGNLLLDFKSLNSMDLKEYDLNYLLKTGINLGGVYTTGKEIELVYDNKITANILVDENKFLSVLINLIKNAVENIEEKGQIVISTKNGNEEETIKIKISNTGSPMSKEVQERIFEEGFTTKSTGSGLGLAICKQTLEEQFAKLSLIKSDKDSTEFEITVLKGGLEG